MFINISFVVGLYLKVFPLKENNDDMSLRAYCKFWDGSDHRSAFDAWRGTGMRCFHCCEMSPLLMDVSVRKC